MSRIEPIPDRALQTIARDLAEFLLTPEPGHDGNGPASGGNLRGAGPVAVRPERE